MKDLMKDLMKDFSKIRCSKFVANYDVSFDDAIRFLASQPARAFLSEV
jgi:hypothetical protein